jgi:uncharacterized protein
MTRGTRPRSLPASRTLVTFLAISMGWAALVGAGLFLTGTPLGSLQAIVVMAVLYMPSPFVAAVIAERGIRRDRFRLPRRGLAPWARFLLAPVAAVLAFVALYAGALLLGGNLLDLAGFGGLARSASEIAASAAQLLGQDAVDAAGPPPSVVVLLLGAVWGAIVAGWTVNGLVAMGEEYGWRGLMWEELRHLGVVRANLATGTAWGLWHAPVIMQGYNYGSPLLGVLAMVVFCIAMSFVLSAIREGTSSVLTVAAAHGIFNALVPIFLILAPATVPLLTGPLGILGSVLLLMVGTAAWAWIRARGAWAEVVAMSDGVGA